MGNPVNIQIRLMAIAIFSVLITGLSSVYLLDSVQRAENLASSHQQRLLVAALALEKAHTQFKIQVQEWKNLLLRGKDPEAYQKHFASFNQQTESVQKLFAEAQPVFSGIPRQQIDELASAHQKLVATYLQALGTAKLNNPDNVGLLDKSLRGIDRPLDAAFPKLTEYLAQAVKNNLQQNSHLHAQAYRKHVGWISLCVSISTVLIAASFWVGIKAQASRK